MKSPQIAFFGSSLISAYWNGAATYYRGILRGLHARGYKITFYEPDAFERQRYRDIESPEYSKVVIYSPTEEAAAKCLHDAHGADIIVKASGVGVLDAYLEKSTIELKRPGTCTIFWDVDAPATLERVISNPHDPFRELIPKYDLVLVYGGGDPVVNAYTALGARVCIPIYNALDPSTHYAVPPDPKFQSDLGFLGNRMPDREQRVEEFFLKPAAMLPHKQFILGGSGWKDKSVPQNVNVVGHLGTDDHNAFNCSSLAVLNISRESMVRFGFSPATRVFEAAGAGVAIITDAWPGIEYFLEPGREILVAETGEGVAEHLSNLTEERSRSIGQAALRRVLAEHTYTHRAAQFDELFRAKTQRLQSKSLLI